MKSTHLLCATLMFVACTSPQENEGATQAPTEPKPNSVPMALLVPPGAAQGGGAMGGALLVPAKSAEAPATEPALDPREERVAVLEREYRAAQDAFFGEYRQLKTDEERAAFQKEHTQPRAADWSLKMLAIANESLGDAAALRACLWVVANDRAANGGQALGWIKEHHLGSPKLSTLCAVMGRVDTTESRSTLALLLEKSPHIDVRGRACLALANLDRNAAGDLRDIVEAQPDEAARLVARLPQALRDRRPEDLERSAIGLFERVRNEFGGVVDGKSTLGIRADNAIYELQNLTVGKSVPEIAGDDVDEVAFKLSDYKGKVVMLDFWGSW